MEPPHEAPPSTEPEGRGASRRYPPDAAGRAAARPARPQPDEPARSEEHTSELQSRENLVCRLLLEKKKDKHARDRTDKNGKCEMQRQTHDRHPHSAQS